MSAEYWSIASDKSNIRATYNQLERHRLPLISFPLGFLFSLGNKKSEQFQGPASSQCPSYWTEADQLPKVTIPAVDKLERFRTMVRPPSKASGSADRVVPFGCCR